jgi:hypothetical protein
LGGLVDKFRELMEAIGKLAEESVGSGSIWRSWWISYGSLDKLAVMVKWVDMW